MFKKDMPIKTIVKKFIGIGLSLVMILSLTFVNKVRAEDDIPNVNEYYNEIENYFDEPSVGNDNANYIENDNTFNNEDDYYDDYYDYQDDYDFGNFDDYDDDGYDYNDNYEDDYYDDYSDYDWTNDFTFPNETNTNHDYNYDYSYEDFDYGIFDYMPYPDDGFVFYDDYFEDEFEEEKEHVPGEKFLKTPNTIQYTFDKNSKYPKYFDTGIKVSDETGIDGDMLKELLRQLSVKKNIKIVEDLNRAMALVDGKLIILEGNVTDGKTLEKLFEETSISVKVQPTRAGGKFTLADYLEYKGEVIVEVNGEKVNLITDPVIENSRVLFPIRSIAKAMGANVEWNEKTKEAIVKKDGKTIVFKADSDIVTVDGVKYLISNKTSLNKEANRILSVLNLLVNELDGEMYWDRTNSILKIETPQEEINPDADFR